MSIIQSEDLFDILENTTPTLPKKKLGRVRPKPSSSESIKPTSKANSKGKKYSNVPPPPEAKSVLSLKTLKNKINAKLSKQTKVDSNLNSQSPHLNGISSNASTSLLKDTSPAPKQPNDNQVTEAISQTVPSTKKSRNRIRSKNKNPSSKIANGEPLIKFVPAQIPDPSIVKEIKDVVDFRSVNSPEPEPAKLKKSKNNAPGSIIQSIVQSLEQSTEIPDDHNPLSPKGKSPKEKSKKKNEPKAKTQEAVQLSTSENSRSNQSKRPRSNSRFEQHMDALTAKYLLKAGKLIRAEFRVNASRRIEGYAIQINGDNRQDIFILGSRNQNRAMDGDIVAIQLYSETEGFTLIQKYCTKSFADEKIAKKYRVGKVVQILKRDTSVTYIGSLRLCDNSLSPQKTNDDVSKTSSRKDHLQSKHFRFIPVNSRIPLIIIPKMYIKQEIINDWELYSTYIFQAKLTHWNESDKIPWGMIVKCLGPMGELKSTNKNILVDNTISDKPFTNAILKDLPKVPFKINLKTIKKRLDLRKECIFTIDPETARDLDDAVSIKKLDNGNFKVGAHIADVSHFIKPGSALDLEALSRGSSVYLVDRVIPMLPELLCQDLCSLNPGVDRLTFSVLWELDPEGNRLSTAFSKSVIRSCCKMAYENAQDVIEGQSLNPNLKIHGSHEKSKIEENIKYLFQLSQKMRHRRFESGAITLNKFRVAFALDENGFPTSCSNYQTKESNKLIEEFMLLANMSVAEKIYEEYPTRAMMRCHPYPKPDRLKEFEDYCHGLKLDFDTSSSLGMKKFLEGISDPIEKICLETLAIKMFMMRAKYICNSEDADISNLHHYALNVDHYTHFTSPIRRYPDIVVHRELISILTGKDQFSHGANKVPMDDIVYQCNVTKQRAKVAQEQSSDLYLAHYLHKTITDTNHPVPATGYIFHLDHRSFQVMIPEYGLEEIFKFEYSFNYSIATLGTGEVRFWVPEGLDFMIKKDNTHVEDSIHLSETDSEVCEEDDTQSVQSSVATQPDSQLTKDEKLALNKRELFEADCIPQNIQSQLDSPELKDRSIKIQLYQPIPLKLEVTMKRILPVIHIRLTDLPFEQQA